MDARTPQQESADWDFWKQGLDRNFFKRIYLRATQLSVVAALIFLGFEQRPIAAGLLAGLAVGLASLWTVEMTVKLLFNSGRHAGLKLTIGACLKLPFFLVGLLGIAYAGRNGFMDIFAVISGVLVVHGTILVLAVGTAVAHKDTVRERYQ